MIDQVKNIVKVKCDSYTDEDRELERDLERHQVEDEFYEHEWALNQKKQPRQDSPELQEDQLRLDDIEDLVDTQPN